MRPAPATGTVDDYIRAFPIDVRRRLREIRAVIRKAAPAATEAMKYGIPTLVLGKNLVHFAAFTAHVGFYPGASGVRAFREEFVGYECSKGAIRFPFAVKIPRALVTRIVKFRIRENAARAPAMRRGKKSEKSASRARRSSPAK